jgi:hypothetical protein
MTCLKPLNTNFASDQPVRLPWRFVEPFARLGDKLPRSIEWRVDDIYGGSCSIATSDGDVAVHHFV